VDAQQLRVARVTRGNRLAQDALRAQALRRDFDPRRCLRVQDAAEVFAEQRVGDEPR
jgi:hypothetical protein